MIHMKKISTLIVSLAVAASAAMAGDAPTGQFAGKVNTLIGNKGVGLTSGYLYPGATYPFGMVQFTPSYFSKRAGFVINQLSGGGCAIWAISPPSRSKGN